MKTITVCSKCLRASCWTGMFYCDDYRVAGTIEKTIDELKELNLEHESYFNNKEYVSEETIDSKLFRDLNRYLDKKNYPFETHEYTYQYACGVYYIEAWDIINEMQDTTFEGNKKELIEFLNKELGDSL